MQSSKQHEGLRKTVAVTLGYNDRNDGFNRSSHSLSKINYSRIHKTTKPQHVKAPHKAIVNHIY